ncbi:hypothetical protein [Streptomyces olivaceoviridis]
MSTEAVGWQSGAIRLGLAGGTALAGPGACGHAWHNLPTATEQP